MSELRDTMKEGKPLSLETKKILKKIIKNPDTDRYHTLDSDHQAHSDT